MYNIEIEHTAVHFLKRLHQLEYDRIIRGLRQLADTPRPNSCRKLKSGKNDYRIRIGDWRIVYEVDDGMQTVRILRIALRKDVYR
ncbi:MAG: type II toxin-antitoxin system RelE/ParE family toxin [Calditrichota bacterium]